MKTKVKKKESRRGCWRGDVDKYGWSVRTLSWRVKVSIEESLMDTDTYTREGVEFGAY